MAAKPQSSLFQKAKREIKAQQLDEYGNQVEFDVRKDEEQDVKLEDTIRLLLAAGYFRARIKSLSPFDKIVGGMTWCITASNEDVDVDVLFEENANIGQKIALTEKIVAVLPRLKCPLRLEPHQIQGLDCISIYPVVQWLVKKALETRDELNAQQRNSALFEFDKFGCTPEDEAFNNALPKASSSVQHVQEVYLANRQLKAPNVGDADEETRIQCTLLEYGRRFGASKIPKAQKGDAVKKKLEGGQSEEDLIKREEQRVNAIMKKMTALEDEPEVSTSFLGEISGAQSKEIQELSAEYAKEAQALAGTSGESGTAAHKRAVATLEKQIAVTASKTQVAEAKHAELEKEYNESQEELLKMQAYEKRIAKEMAKLDDLEGDEANRDVLAELRRLVALNEGLKAQEVSFKQTCQAEMEELDDKIEKLEGSGVEILDDERTRAIAKQYADDQEKLKKIKMLAARRTREIANLHRKIDEFPGRAELNQYQRRFVELASQVLTKLRETKQFYTLYNCLDDTKLYLAKEVKLLESVQESYTIAGTSTKSKNQLLEQMTTIVQSLSDNYNKLVDRQGKEQSKRDDLSSVLQSLVEKERQYYKSVKDYETECSKNELLIAKLKRRNK
eukprot:m.485309 g.485309  ORF g.485309 m.485309 type:complete len:618 (-) comp21733_c0_seq2:2285-4138(-)